MTVGFAIKRRDPRYRLRQGAGTVTFRLDSGERGAGDLIQAGLGGVGFEMATGPRLTKGTYINGATISIGTCETEVDLSVIHCRRGPDSSIEVGCLIYPCSEEFEDKWVAVLAGLAAARAD